VEVRSIGRDAQLSVILAQLDQLKPLLSAHVDVITAVDAGFIGAWGEWHVSQRDYDQPAHPAKQQLVTKRLELPPADRTITLRRRAHQVDALAAASPVSQLALATLRPRGLARAPGGLQRRVRDRQATRSASGQPQPL
jgi:hypothetical protein